MGSVATPEAPQASSGYDQNYRVPTTPPGESYGGEEAGKPQPGGASIDSPVRRGLGAVKDWAAPSAFAADHDVSEEYIIRTGDLTLRCEDIDKSITAINALAAKYKGSITGSSINKDYEGRRSGYITIRVPSPDFMTAFTELAKVAELVSQNIQTQDAGQEYLAAVSRLDALNTEQATLQEMLKEALAVQRTRGLGEGYSVLLDTQSRLSEVTAQINEVEMRAGALADQITRSTITVNLTEKPSLPGTQPQAGVFRWDLGPVFKDAVHNLLANLRGLLHWLIRFFVEGYWFWWALIILGGRWAWRRLKPRIMAKPKAAAVE